MSAIVSDKFHVHNARQFVESLSETANDVYYLFIGRPTPWTVGDGTPDTPEDSTSNTAFGFWNDIVALRRITTDDLVYCVPRYNWVANTQYNMADSRSAMTSLAANTSNPFYVVTANYEVFKCIYNGRVNSAGAISNSTVEPTTSGQADITALTSSSGSPNTYVWKYLYTIPTSSALKYLTANYMPVSASHDTLNANGDVSDDGTNQYDVFHAARTSGNGSIRQITVEAQGSGYTNSPTVSITGDGSGATAVAVVASGKVTQITMSAVGTNYSYANVAITANGDSGTGATAEAILSPRAPFTNSTGLFYISNHGINLPEELVAKYVMLYVELDGSDEGGLIATGNDYRRIGIIRNPLLYGSGTIATANVYSQSTDLTLSSLVGTFTKDELVWQGSTNAYGVVIETSGSTLKLTNVRGTFSTSGTTTILGIGNGNNTGMVANASITIPSQPGTFTPVIAASGATASVTAIGLPDITPYSGTVLYIDHRAPITRANDQTEVIRTILSF
jgi:hypothetical protein